MPRTQGLKHLRRTSPRSLLFDNPPRGRRFPPRDFLRESRRPQENELLRRNRERNLLGLADGLVPGSGLSCRHARLNRTLGIRRLAFGGRAALLLVLLRRLLD